MTPRRINSIYYPMTIPRPERVRRWECKVNYASAEVVHKGLVCATRYTVTAPFLEGRGRRIAFAADFHYRGTARDRQLAAEAARLVREWKPDVFCFGGDLIADASELGTLPELLKEFRDIAPLTLAVPGNWERGKVWLPERYWEDAFLRYGIHYLCNSGLEHDGFYFYGCDDPGYGDPLLPVKWPEGKAVVLLAHRPDTVIALDVHQALKPVALALCGHTHGGQVRLPLIGPLYASSMYGCRLAYGLFKRRDKDCRMVVSSGIGNYSFPWRFNCRREIVQIEFV